MRLSDPLSRLVESIENDASLMDEAELHRRLQRLDLLDAYFGAGADSLALAPADAAMLCRRVNDLSARLDAVNETLYAELRRAIRRGEGATAFDRWLPRSSAENEDDRQTRGMGYDELDELIRGVFAFQPPAAPPAATHPEMVFCQPTPARHIFCLIERMSLTSTDVLVDLGSGLGHVALLVGACTAARAIGIELEPTYIACARMCADDLHLNRVEFIQQDARAADVSTGSVFYLHTPFTGSIMRTVLDMLREEASRRPIRVCTYGPCTAVIAGERWLDAVTSTAPDRVAVFRSRT